MHPAKSKLKYQKVSLIRPTQYAVLRTVMFCTIACTCVLTAAAVYGASSAPDVQLPVRRHFGLHRSLPRSLDQPLPVTVRGLCRHA